MRAQHLGKHLRLGVTEFWELRGHMGHGAIMLADLNADLASRNAVNGGGETLLGQHPSQHSRTFGRGDVRQCLRESLSLISNPRLGELANTFVTEGLPQVAQDIARQRRICGRSCRSASLSDGVDASGPASTACRPRTVRRLLGCRSAALLSERI